MMDFSEALQKNDAVHIAEFAKSAGIAPGTELLSLFPESETYEYNSSAYTREVTSFPSTDKKPSLPEAPSTSTLTGRDDESTRSDSGDEFELSRQQQYDFVSTPNIDDELITMDKIPSAFARRFRAIITDMDGTFFGPQLSLSAATLQAYHRARRLGIPVIPATGRLRVGVSQALQKYKLAGNEEPDVQLNPGIYLNGALIYAENDGGPSLSQDASCDVPRWHAQLPSNAVKTARDFVADVNRHEMSQVNWDSQPGIADAPTCHGFASVVNQLMPPAFVSLIAFTHKAILYEQPDQLNDGMRQFNDGPNIQIEDILACPEPLYKLLLIFHSGECAARYRKRLDALMETADCATVVALERIVEIVPKGISKGSASKIVASHLNLPLDSMAALGDGANDIDMLRSVGFSVAMGNASTAVKSTADAITASHDVDGWARAVNALLDAKERETSRNKSSFLK